MNATLTEKLLGRFDVSTLVSPTEEGIAHPDDGAGDYRPLGGVVRMDEPSKPATAHAKTDSPSTLPSTTRKPLRLFPRRKRTATPPDAYRE